VSIPFPDPQMQRERHMAWKQWRYFKLETCICRCERVIIEESRRARLSCFV